MTYYIKSTHTHTHMHKIWGAGLPKTKDDKKKNSITLLLPPPSGRPPARQSPTAGLAPLRARGQSWSSQNYYWFFFCVMTREKKRGGPGERNNDMKVYGREEVLIFSQRAGPSPSPFACSYMIVHILITCSPRKKSQQGRGKGKRDDQLKRDCENMCSWAYKNRRSDTLYLQSANKKMHTHVQKRKTCINI